VVELGAYRQSEIPPAKIALGIFLAVVTSLFGLFITAYYMRMGMGHSHGAMPGHSDWSSIPKPPVLWLNTAALVGASVAMQWARNIAVRGNTHAARLALVIGGMLTLVFLVGQLAAWTQVREAPYFNPRNPAVAFFYVLTAVHGVHLLGGMYVWGRTLFRLGKDSTRLTVQLCSVYWHYLLLVWLVLFGLLLLT
jgi:cytochrome c oxidase subunit 3